MEILEEIKQSFANLQRNQSIFLANCNARAVMFDDETYGLGIPYSSNEKVNEKFANVKLYSHQIVIEGSKEGDNYLLLTSSLKEMRNEFALICADFADLGRENENRNNILEDPFSWWKRWRKLMGNAVKNPMVHSILGEMLALKYLLAHTKGVKWNPLDFSTHDIETNDRAFEVKSTTSKYEDIISVNSQFQLTIASGKVSLVLCKLERSNLGYSINSLIDSLSSYGLDRQYLNNMMDEMGYPEGSSSREERYQLLEMRKYDVDNNFPGEGLREYIREMNVPSVRSVTYDIDLNGVNFEKLNV
jgi:hypothetical protein